MKQTSSTQPEHLALLCIGNRPADPAALRLAKGVIQAMEVDPVLFHVAPPGTSPDVGKRKLQDVQAILDMDEAEILLRDGRVFSQIRRELDRRSYRLLVLGTSTHEDSAPMSSLARRLAECVDTSVLIVRNPPVKLEKVLICTGGHIASSYTVTVGIRIAQGTGSLATILHVASGAPAMYTGLPAIEEDLSQVLSRDIPLSSHLKEAAALAEESGVQARLELRHGLVVEEILRACDVYPHDLVVLGGHHPKPLLDRLVLGRVTPKVLPSSQRSTLIVR
jgi:nucleotide-binding universal stress UspA family protein